jgi:hypothetical protein
MSKLIKLNNVKFAKFATLADNSIRLTMDTQELSSNDVAQLNDFKKEGEVSVILADEVETDLMLRLYIILKSNPKLLDEVLKNEGLH